MLNFCEMCELMEGPEDNAKIDMQARPHGAGGRSTKAAIARGDIHPSQMRDLPKDARGYASIWQRPQDPHIPSMNSTLGELDPAKIGSDIPRQVYNLMDKNAQKYQPGKTFTIDQLVKQLQADGLRADPQLILKALLVLTKQVTVPVFTSSQNGGTWTLTVNKHKPDASKVVAPSAQTKQQILNPDEDQWAKPGEGGRYSKTPAVNTANSPERAIEIAKADAISKKKELAKAYDMAMDYPTNHKAFDQAARTYLAALGKLGRTMGITDELRRQIDNQKKDVVDKWHKFIAVHGEPNDVPTDNV